MQANLGQNTTNEDRRMQAQPLHADILSHLVTTHAENSVAALASSADLFQQVFDDALQQRTLQQHEMRTDEYTSARPFTDDSRVATWDTSPSVASGNERHYLDTYEHATAPDRDPSRSDPTHLGENRDTPRDAASPETQSPESASSTRGQGEQTQATQEKTTAAETPAKATDASSASNAPGTPNPHSNTTAAKQAAKTAAVSLPIQSTTSGAGTSSPAQAATANAQAFTHAGQTPSAGGDSDAMTDSTGTGKAPSPSQPGIAASQSAPLQGSLCAQAAGKLAGAIQARPGAKLALSATASPTSVTGVAATAASIDVSGLQVPASMRAAAATLPGMSPGNTLTGQITQSMQTAVRGSSRELVVQLHPAELGRIAIRFRQDGDQLIGMIQVSQRQVRADIEQAVPQILQNLAQNGTQVRRIDVEIQGDPDAPESGSQEREATNSEAQQRGTSSQGSDQQFEEDTREFNADSPTGETPVVDAGTGRVNMLL